MKILVTGGCGFIGVNCIRQLLKNDAEIIVYDNLSMGKEEDIAKYDVELIKGDVKDYEKLAEASKGCDSVIHLAAHTRVIESIEDPRTSMMDNVLGTFNVLEACRNNNIKRVVIASTGGAIIGDAEPPVHEGMVPKPISPYGASKLCCEAYCSAYAGSYGVNCIALRFANVYGPFSYHKGSVVAKYFKNILQDNPLTVFGDGTQTRDFVFVEDLCEAIEKAVYSQIQGFEAFHLGSGIETSVNTLLEYVKQIIGNTEYPVKYEPARAGEVYRNYTIIDKAKKMLHFNPKNNFREGLQKTWEWFQENREKI
ncbi:MAG: NAD-dependent epimerase/dehydratase family protein [Spirochaetia bacterium]